MEHPLALLRYSTIAPSHRERPIKQGRADRTVAVDWTAPEGGEEVSVWEGTNLRVDQSLCVDSEMGWEVLGRRRVGRLTVNVSQQETT